MIHKLFGLAAVVSLLAAITASNARAHAALEVREAAVGAGYKAIVRITHGCDGSPTIRVRIQIPEGVIGAKPMPKPGWTLQTVRGPYAKSYDFYHGKVLSEGVKEVIWTGKLPDEHYDEFVFAAFLHRSLTPGSTIHFPTTQDCERGSHAWTEVPAPGQSARELAQPAPGLRLLPAAERTVAAPSFKTGALLIEAPWTRATPQGAKVAGGYLKITNTGSQPDRLIGGSLPGAADVEVHEMAMTDNIMKMRRLDIGLEIKPGESVELKPGGYHLMFTGLGASLKEGQAITGTLVFEKAGTVTVEYRVAPIGAQTPGHTHH